MTPPPTPAASGAPVDPVMDETEPVGMSVAPSLVGIVKHTLAWLRKREYGLVWCTTVAWRRKNSKYQSALQLKCGKLRLETSKS